MPRYLVQKTDGTLQVLEGTLPLDLKPLLGGEVVDISTLSVATTVDLRVAPTITASSSVTGRTVTITVDSTTGDPAPTTALTSLTLDGAPVSPTTTGSNVWTYDVPDSTAAQTVAWTVSASNSLSTATSSGSETIAAQASWTPAELFSATDKGFAFDLIDLSGANTSHDQTGTTPGAGDPLGYLPGISPNAKTATQSVSTERPIVQVNANGQKYLAFDSTDVLSTTEELDSYTWTVWMVYEPDGGDYIMLSDTGDSNPWLGIGQQNSDNTTIATPSANGIDSAEYWYDNTLFTGSTRGQSWTAGQNANLLIAEAVINNNEPWPEAGVGNYNNTGIFSTPGKTYAWGVINRALTSTERADLLAYADYVRGV